MRKALHRRPKRLAAPERPVVPPTEEPVGVVELDGHGDYTQVWCIVPLPGGNRLATAASDGNVRVFEAATGALEREIDAHEGWVGQRALVALGGDVIASGGWSDGKLATWVATSGERLGEVVVGSGVKGLAVLGDGRLVAGTMGRDVIFYKHRDGCDVTESARIADAHKGVVNDIASCGNRLATASADGTAAVWNAGSHERVAVLRGHSNFVSSVHMNDRIVVTGSWDNTVRVWNAADGYTCTIAVDCLQSHWVRSAVIVGSDHVLSSSAGGTARVTQVSTGVVLARVRLGFPAAHAAVFPDGRLAVSGSGNAQLLTAPPSVADLFKAHGAVAFPHAAGGESSSIALAIGLDTAVDDGVVFAHLNNHDPDSESAEEVDMPLYQTIAEARHAVEAGDMQLSDFMRFLKAWGQPRHSWGL